MKNLPSNLELNNVYHAEILVVFLGLSRWVSKSGHDRLLQNSIKLIICNSVALVRKRTIPTERPPLVGQVSVKFADRECRVVSTTDPHGR
jgi:hypothetical protein